MSTTVAGRDRAPLRAIANMCAAMGCYALSDACIKVLAGVLPSGQVLALRAAAGLLLLGALFVCRRKGPAGAQASAPVGRNPGLPALPWILLRCAAEGAAGFLTVLALVSLPLATAGALMLTAPLLIVLAVMTLGWEPWSVRRLVLATSGLAGALLVVGPGWRVPAEMSSALSAAGCAIALAVRDLATRRIPAHVAATHVALAASATALATGAAAGLLTGEHWTLPLGSQTLVLAAAGLFSTIGNVLLVTACRSAPLALLAPWRYSFLLWSAALGALVWTETPSPSALAGMTLIAAAGAGSVRSRD